MSQVLYTPGCVGPRSDAMEPTCGKCGVVMTPEDARLRPELFLHDGCLPDEFLPEVDRCPNMGEPMTKSLQSRESRLNVAALLLPYFLGRYQPSTSGVLPLNESVLLAIRAADALIAAVRRRDRP